MLGASQGISISNAQTSIDVAVSRSQLKAPWRTWKRRRRLNSSCAT